MKMREKQKRLDQFTDLINADLRELSDADRYVLGGRFLFSTPLSVLGKKQTAEGHWKAVIESLPKVQTIFKKFFNMVMELKEGKMLPLPPIRRLMSMEGGNLKVLEETTKPEARLKQIVATGIDDPVEEMLLSDIGELGMLLDGIPQSAFRKCKNPTCGKVFIHLSKKPKIFCSPSCTSTFLSRQRRDRLKG